MFVYLLLLVFIEYSVCVDVNTTSGVVRGLTVNALNTSVDQFLNIPYAEPPVDGLRFQKPLPVRHVPDPYDATQWPKACIHQKLHQNYLNQEMSEDCLYLNIWSPSEPKPTGALK